MDVPTVSDIPVILRVTEFRIEAMGLNLGEFAFQVALFIEESIQGSFPQLVEFLTSVLGTNQRERSLSNIRRMERELQTTTTIRLANVAMIRGPVSQDLTDLLNRALETALYDLGGLRRSLANNPFVAQSIVLLDVAIQSFYEDTEIAPQAAAPLMPAVGKGLVQTVAKGKGVVSGGLLQTRGGKKGAVAYLDQPYKMRLWMAMYDSERSSQKNLYMSMMRLYDSEITQKKYRWMGKRDRQRTLEQALNKLS